MLGIENSPNIANPYIVSNSRFLLCFTNYLEHSCQTPGCRNVLVLDGNMKNARQVCMLKDAGELHFSTIQGTVQVGKLQSDSYIVNKNPQQIMNGVFIP